MKINHEDILINSEQLSKVLVIIKSNYSCYIIKSVCYAYVCLYVYKNTEPSLKLDFQFVLHIRQCSVLQNHVSLNIVNSQS